MKIYILKKDCPNISKEVGDYYNGEYGESIEELLKKGVIEEEECGCECHFIDIKGCDCDC